MVLLALTVAEPLPGPPVTSTPIGASPRPVSLARTFVTTPAWASSATFILLSGAPSSLARGVSSSSVMVPVPPAAPMEARTGLVRVTEKVSSFSSRLSPLTGTVIVSCSSPAAKFVVPLVAV